MGWIKDNKDAFNRYRQAKDKYYTAEAYLNNAELGGNEEAQSMAQRDLKDASNEIRTTRGQLIWGNLYRGK
jgi:hypothetical protein